MEAFYQRCLKINQSFFTARVVSDPLSVLRFSRALDLPMHHMSLAALSLGQSRSIHRYRFINAAEL
jgi:hypothetical protein